MTENEVAKEVVDAAYKVHNTFGPGLLESAYEKVLAFELTQRGLRVERQVAFPLAYEGVVVDEAFRADLLVEGIVIVEVKSVEKAAAVHHKQLLTYLRVSGLRLGLLINFGMGLIKDGIKRVVNQLEASA
ncbi:MAG: GxxExxY protein [Planctomycetota bacterium]